MPVQIRPGKLYCNDVSTCYREWIWDILGRGLDLSISEARGLRAMPPEALGCLVFELPKI